MRITDLAGSAGSSCSLVQSMNLKGTKDELEYMGTAVYPTPSERRGRFCLFQTVYSLHNLYGILYKLCVVSVSYFGAIVPQIE